MVSFVITEHAKARFKERWKLEGTVEDVAKESVVAGSALTRNLQRTVMYLGYHIDNFWTSTYRVYKDMVFVFRKEYTKNNNTILVLVTVFPLSYLKARRAKMLRNSQENNKKKPRKLIRS